MTARDQRQHSRPFCDNLNLDWDTLRCTDTDPDAASHIAAKWLLIIKDNRCWTHHGGDGGGPANSSPAPDLCVVQLAHFSQRQLFKDSGATNLALLSCRIGQTPLTRISIRAWRQIRLQSAVSCQDGRWCDHNSSCVRGRPGAGVKCGSRVSTLCVHSNAHQLGHSPTQGQQSKLTLWKNRRLQIFHILLIADFIDRQHLRVRRVCY